ncbi:hypothetical protein [Clostridium grantii]|uniref:Uncharacterized protein n=1 Tax=Clostridium grantii DSM 8605 TaxID=1121316 RepID=A0A1M5WKM1_9CLOT|nr:hypothetical protein [Clostridium grantii]SHH87982.1 hypothetical protein SAMN02745207_02958 [Clostridium grantii DSM 8605]
MKRKNVSYYYKYLISYIIIFIIPIFFIASYVNMSIFKTLEQEVITNEVNSLYQVKNGIESYLIQMKRIKEEVYLNTNKKTWLF